MGKLLGGFQDAVLGLVIQPVKPLERLNSVRPFPIILRLLPAVIPVCFRVQIVRAESLRVTLFGSVILPRSGQVHRLLGQREVWVLLHGIFVPAAHGAVDAGSVHAHLLHQLPADMLIAVYVPLRQRPE